MKSVEHNKKIFWSFILILLIINIIFLGKNNFIQAKILNSGHDITSRPKVESVYDPGGKQGLCSYCHVPHSAVGRRLWVRPPDTTYKSILGEVGTLCYTQCHDGIREFAPNIDPIIVTASFDSATHTLIDYDTTPNTKKHFSGWPYTRFGLKNFECTSCHDVHDQNNKKEVTSPTAKKGNFLRAPMYDSSKRILNPAPKVRQIVDTLYETVYVDEPSPYGLPPLFCAYCHLERTYDSSGKGTHPIFKHGFYSKDNKRGITNGVFIDTTIFAIEETTKVITFISNYDSPTGGHLSFFDSGEIICNTCHKAHGAAPGGKLLVLDNYDTFNMLGGGRNFLCETCHDTHPSLSDPEDVYSAHPVDTASVDYYSSRGHLLYINIPKKGPFYSENWPTFDIARQKGVLCLSCHKVHQAQLDTKILRGGKERGDKRICDDCHCPNPKKPDNAKFNIPDKGPAEDTTNPLNTDWSDEKPVYGTESHPVHITLHTSDDKSVTWPNTDWLKLFDTLGKPYNTTNEAVMKLGWLSCETCHNVHRAYSNTALIEYPGDDYSAICVGCHSDYKRLSADSSWAGGRFSLSGFSDPSSKRQEYLGRFTGGYYSNRSYQEDTASIFGANPSAYIIEYETSQYYTGSVPSINATRGFVEHSVIDRLGTHPSGIKIDARYADSTQTFRLGELHAEDVIGFMFKNTWEYGDNEWNDKYPPVNEIMYYGFSNQKSMWGRYGYSDSVIICQSCHTPHGAARGLVERNDGAKKDNDPNYVDPTPNSALLLGNNIDSNLCTACHRNLLEILSDTTEAKKYGVPLDSRVTYYIVTHPLSIKIGNDPSDTTYRDVRSGAINLRCYFEESENTNLSCFISGKVREKYAPANYPKPSVNDVQWVDQNFPPSARFTYSTTKLVCDSCHAPHAAETSSGSRILEAGPPVDSASIAVPSRSIDGGPAFQNLDKNTRFGSKRYKNPKNITYFCEQCHPSKTE